MLNFAPLDPSVQLNKGSIAKLFEHISPNGDKQKLYENKKFVDRLSEYELAALAKDAPYITKAILRNPEILAKFPNINLSPIDYGYNWVHDGGYYSWLTKEIFSLLKDDIKKVDIPNNPHAVAIRLLREHLIHMGVKYEDFAEEIIANETLVALCDDRAVDVCSPLVRIVQAHLGIAEKFIGNFFREQSMSIPLRVSFAVKHEIIAKHIYDFYYSKKLKNDHHAQLARAHDFVGIYVFVKNPSIGLSFNEFELMQCAQNPFNAKWLLKDPFLAKLSGNIIREIAISKNSLAHTVFDTPELFNKLSFDDIVKIAATHGSIAEIVISRQDLYNKLKTDDRVLIATGLQGWKIASEFLPTPEVLSKLDVDSQVRIAKAGITLEGYRFDLPTLLEKLDSASLKYFGINHIFVAEYILETPFLVEKLEHADLCEIQRTVELYNTILQTLGIDKKDKLYEKSWEHLDPLGKTKSPEVLAVSQLCKKLSDVVHELINEQNSTLTESDQAQRKTSKKAAHSQSKQVATKQYSTTYPSQEVFVKDEQMTKSVFGKKRPTW